MYLAERLSQQEERHGCHTKYSLRPLNIPEHGSNRWFLPCFADISEILTICSSEVPKVLISWNK
jgi:hypothetical protein